ncbi:hypothetical protein [Campylobacter concisus]|uniref:hypothetical protein n=1 Tax=Campylobacter concisus TaxID=199 RepID=UPI00112FA8CA|nr:hypothetical protein [Campylobacter concisus]
MQSELFLSFSKSWKQDALGRISVFRNDSAVCALDLAQFSTPRTELLLQPDQDCKETAFHRPL